MSSLAKRILTGATLVVVVVALIAVRNAAPAGTVVFGVATALALLGAWELGHMDGFREQRLSPALPLAALAVAVPAWFGREELCAPERPFMILIAGATVVAIVAAALAGNARARAVGLGVWAIVPLFGLLSIDLVYGAAGLAVLILLSKIGDIFGYFVGRSIGVRHPFPNLSPGKTVAGCVASLIAGIVAGALLGQFGALPGTGGGILSGALLGAAMNLAAQAGDLFESKVKRTAGVKDSSGLVGAAGGVLDVVDSLLFTVPVALVLWPLLFGSGPPALA